MKGAEDKQRDELFSGATAPRREARHVSWARPAPDVHRHRQQQDQQEQQPQPQRQQQHMSSKELLQEGLEMHTDTTNRLRGALKGMEETVQVQAATGQQLVKQSAQIAEMDGKMEKVQDDIRYSEKLLAFMQRCCLCRCFGDPQRQREEAWRRRVEGQQGQANGGPNPLSQPTLALTQKAVAPAAQQADRYAPTPPPVSTQGLREAGHGAEAEAIDAHTRVQDQIIDRIADLAATLKHGARVQHEHLLREAPALERVQGRVEEADSRVQGMNHHSMLSKYR